MFFSSVLIASFLLAFMVLARSDGGHHPSRPHNHVDAASDSSIALVGAGWYAEQPGTFESVSGTFNVPIVNTPASSGVSIYVGLDGFPCEVGLSAGVDIVVDEANKASYQAFYSWNAWDVLSNRTYFQDLIFSPNDDIEVVIDLASSTEGIVVMRNLNTNQAVSAVPSHNGALCMRGVRWIVEEGHESTPIADFGTVTFTDGLASSDVLYTLEGATIIQFPNDQPVGSVSVNGDSITVVHA